MFSDIETHEISFIVMQTRKYLMLLKINVCQNWQMELLIWNLNILIDIKKQ